MRRFGGKEYWQNMRKSSTESRAKTYSDFKSETYGKYEFQTFTKEVDGTKRPVLIIYKGQSGKAISNYWYSSEDSRSKAIDEYKKRSDKQDAYKKERDEKRNAFKNPFKPGDILYSAWGYEQTNIDFYEVLSVTEKSVKIIGIGQKNVGFDVGFMSEYVVADPRIRKEKIMTKRVQPYGDGSISLSSYASAWKWDGRELNQTHYH